ncbi:LCP family protein, partial [Candidatus Saccharibacteria bacterium]|nr:LCP family protein [Candidatus Saccharibacteria bacterium]
VMRDIVKALGTITVNIEGSNGAPGVMDSNFDWKCKGGNSYASRATMIKNCPPNGHFIDYPNGPAVLDAEHALYLAQARGDSAPTYGLDRSNFDREVNQQKILLAIREKALSTGTLTDIAKVTALIDALGNNLRTNLETSEVRTVMSLASDIQPESIQRLDLNKSGVFNDAGQPTAGQFNYSGLRSFIKKSLSADPVVREAASVAVYNASGVPGAAEKVAQQIEDAGLLRSEVTNSPVESAASYEIYVISKDKTASRAKLEQLYGTQAKETNPPFAVTGVNFVVIIGSNNNQ